MIVRICMALAVLILAGSCATLGVDPFPEPIREPKPAVAVDDGSAGDGDGDEEDDGIRLSPTPGVVIQKTIAEGIADRLGQNLRGDPILVSFHEVELVPFINEVFGELLGMSFSISSRAPRKIGPGDPSAYRAGATQSTVLHCPPGVAGIRNCRRRAGRRADLCSHPGDRHPTTFPCLSAAAPCRKCLPPTAPYSSS